MTSIWCIRSFALKIHPLEGQLRTVVRRETQGNYVILKCVSVCVCEHVCLPACTHAHMHTHIQVEVWGQVAGIGLLYWCVYPGDYTQVFTLGCECFTCWGILLAPSVSLFWNFNSCLHNPRMMVYTWKTPGSKRGYMKRNHVTDTENLEKFSHPLCALTIWIQSALAALSEAISHLSKTPKQPLWGWLWCVWCACRSLMDVHRHARVCRQTTHDCSCVYTSVLMDTCCFIVNP